MRTGYSPFILALVCTTRLAVHAQEPLTPLWMHVDPYGAGSLLASYDVLATRISYDLGTDRIYRSIIVFNWEGPYKIQVFDPEGNDITPSPAIELHGILPGDYQVTQIEKLSATNDTLSAIVHGEFYFNETDDLNWLKVLGTDGSPYLLLGCGSTPLNDYYQDATSTLLLTGDDLRRYGPTNWPDGSIATPPSEGMAVLGNDVVLGAPPSISRIDRSNMTALSPIAVPSSGTAATGICISNGSSTFNYAALNSNGTMDVGLADVNSGVIWSNIISIPAQAQPTAYHVDEQGDLWIAIALNATDVATLGLLYRFHFSGGSYGVNTFSRRIDDITSNGSRLFLTGRVEGSMTDTYLAAFDIDLITGTSNVSADDFNIYPDPAIDVIRIDGLEPKATRVEISDATGRFVREVKGPFLGSLNIPVSDLTNGAYLLRCSGDDFVTTRHFSVLR